MRSSRLPCAERSYPSAVLSIGTKPRVQSPLERRPSMVSMDRPEMESGPHEFLLHHCSTWEALSPNKELNTGESIHPVHFYLWHAGTSS